MRRVRFKGDVKLPEAPEGGWKDGKEYLVSSEVANYVVGKGWAVDSVTGEEHEADTSPVSLVVTNVTQSLN